MKLRNKELFIYTVIIVLQILVILYWADVKVNYHIDELYSMGYASNFSHNGDIGQYITTSPDFRFNEWISNSDLKKHLIVSKSERAFCLPVGTLINKLFTERNYMIILNIAESIAGLSYISSVPGLCLNLLFFVVAEIMLIILMKKLNLDEKIRCFALAMFGFSGYMISAAIYIRFYMLVIMIMIMILNCFYRLWVSDNWTSIIFLEITIVILTYLSYKNSELTLPFFGAFMCGFIPALFFANKRKQIIVTLIGCLAGLLYIVTSTKVLKVLLYPQSLDNQFYVGVNASQAIRNVSVAAVTEYILWLKGLFEMYYLSSRTLLYFFLGLVTIIMITGTEKKSKDGIDSYLKRINPAVWLALAIWLVILRLSKTMGHGVLLCLIVLCSIVVTGYLQLIDFKADIQGFFNSTNKVFIGLIAIETVLYTAFCAACEFAIWRYYCFGFVSATIVLWFIIDRILKKDFMKRVNHKLIVIIAAFVVLNSLATFVTRNVENIYEDEKTFTESVRSNSDLDVVLVTAYDEGAISRHDTYDCVNLLPESVNVYVTDIADYEYGKMDYPGEFMLWTHEGRDVSRVLSDLIMNGYDVEELGRDHCSKAYICSR